MSKAILVIDDMPSCCEECFALDFHGDYPRCIITDEQRGYNFNTRIQRMTHCPLKPAPKMQLLWNDDDDWVKGYNNCVREIMGADAEYDS